MESGIQCKLQSRALPYVSLPLLKLSWQPTNCGSGLGNKHLFIFSKLPITLFKPPCPFSFQRPRMVLISIRLPSTFFARSSSSAL